ncbi:hypothetical protein VP01_1879g4 [Puccinia sorghi]|uniref:Uncharacterized protein n=1 Tax=Puccinia sorghi TaxID=27349 RepID=A0A0L6VD54_9BASI|nr:hypothetical protein VP01_1879g4 [Puccinia sorghi]
MVRQFKLVLKDYRRAINSTIDPPINRTLLLSQFTQFNQTTEAQETQPRLLGSGVGNLFVQGIDYDYGCGKAHILENIYLFKFLIQLVESINELERESNDGRKGCNGRSGGTGGMLCGG